VRITADFPDDVYQLARAWPDLKGFSLEDALAELVRRELYPSGVDTSKRLPCFAFPAEAEVITLESTLQAEDEL
jgi:hypothetical protein